MNAHRLQEMVVDKIYSIEDIDYLIALNKILDTHTTERIYHTDDAQKKSIQLSQQQIEAGNYISNAQLEKEEDEWLNA